MFQKYFFNVLKNHYADFSGRTRRKEYWMFVLCQFLIAMLFQILAYTAVFAENPTMSGIIFALNFLFSFGVLIPSLAIVVRRLHDVGRSGWWYLILFVPIIGVIVLFVFLLSDGQPHTNQYGEDPKANERF